MTARHIFVLVVPVIVISNTCVKFDNFLHYKGYMRFHTYQKLPAYSLYDCAAKCLMHAACLSFSYHIHLHVCHLNDNDNITNVIQRNDFLYSNIKPWPKVR